MQLSVLCTCRQRRAKILIHASHNLPPAARFQQNLESNYKKLMDKQGDVYNKKSSDIGKIKKKWFGIKYIFIAVSCRTGQHSWPCIQSIWPESSKLKAIVKIRMSYFLAWTSQGLLIVPLGFHWFRIVTQFKILRLSQPTK